ncbi:MAG: FtsW/RodA/SpoVE family cell cycle protein [Ilumatobacteraceae bacterium]|nr:MAG: rod shape-determining protein RodA [Actinomycetota bacterium]
MGLPLLTRRPDSGLGNIRSSPGDPSRNIDWVLMLTVAVLCTIGVVAIYSATYWRVEGDPYWYTLRQVVFLIVAAVAMVATMAFDYEALKERAYFLYGSVVVALVLVLAVGALRGGARLSFDLGQISMQPAEFAKVGVVLALAAYLSTERADAVSYARFVGGLLIVGVPVGLIVLQPDLGSASVLVVGAMGILLVAGAKVRYIVLVTGLSVATVAAAVISGVVDRYQLRRIEALLNQNSTDEDLQNLVLQVRYAKRAVATGGWFGEGYLEAPLTTGRFIPVQHSDFIFSAVAEQFGMFGGGVLLALFGLMLFRIWRIAHLSKDMLGTYVCAGIFAMLLWHIFQNVGMTMGIMPVTGIPLPFISYGGSSLVAFAIMIGLVQSVHMRRMR